MLVDGTDFRIMQKGPATRGKAFTFQKYVGKSVLRYELGTPKLAHGLEPGDRVESNDCYVGHVDKVKCWNNDCNLEENLTM